MKAFITGLCLLIFLISHTIYTGVIAHITIDQVDRDLWKASNYFFVVLAFTLILIWGVTEWMQKQFMYLASASVLFTLGITIVKNLLLIGSPYLYMLAFDVGTIITTVFILLSGYQNGLFNKE